MDFKEVIGQMYDNIVLKERANKTKFWITKETIEWQQNIIREAHMGRFPGDYEYETIWNILATFSDNDIGNVEVAREQLYEIEPYIYTHDLTAWLHNSSGNVYYLTEALEEYQTTDGFEALRLAHHKFIMDVGDHLLNAIEEYLENEKIPDEIFEKGNANVE